MKLDNFDYLMICCMLFGLLGIILYDAKQTMNFIVYFFESKLIFLFMISIGMFGFMFVLVHRIIHFWS